MRITLNNLKAEYKQLQDKMEKEEILEDEGQEWFNFISEMFWQLKKVQRAFERWIGPDERPNRINPNIYDTPAYQYMKGSEQANVEGNFMDEVLTSKRVI